MEVHFVHKDPHLLQRQLLKDLPFPAEFLGTFVENQFTTYVWAILGSILFH